MASVSRRISDRLSFAKYLFKILESVDDFLLRVEVECSPENILMYCIFQLEVHLMFSFSMENHPEDENNLYAGAILLKLQFLRLWDNILKYLTVSLRMRLLVQEQFFKGMSLFQALIGEEID